MLHEGCPGERLTQPFGRQTDRPGAGRASRWFTTSDLNQVMYRQLRGKFGIVRESGLRAPVPIAQNDAARCRWRLAR